MTSATDLLLADYKLKVDYLTAHLGRMWTRFNFFLVINSALFGYSLGKDNVLYVDLLIIFGLLFSAIWYFFAATDNYLASAYRGQVVEVFALLGPSRERAFEDEGRTVPGWYRPVGSIGEERFDPDKGRVVKIERNFGQWRIKKVSVTELGVVFAVSFALLWLARGVFWLQQSST